MAKAIVTTFHGPTDKRGSRITASDSDGNRLTIGLEPQWNHDTAHQEAAKALCKMMGWYGFLVQGSLGRGREVFVWAQTYCRSKELVGAIEVPAPRDGRSGLDCSRLI